MASTNPVPEAPASPGAAMDRRVEKPRLPRRKLLIAAALAGVIVLALLGWMILPRSGSLVVKGDETQAAEVARAPFQDYLPMRGEVAPLNTVYVAAISGGQVERLMVQDGSEVAAGDVLATLSNPQLKLEVTAREAEIAGRLGDASGQQLNLQSARSSRERELAEAEYNLLKSRRELSIRQRLHDQDLISDIGLKTYADEAAYYEGRVAALRRAGAQEEAFATAQASQIRSTSAQLSDNLGEVRASLGALVLRAPVAGRLTNFILQPGQTIKTGDPVGQIDSEGAYKLIADVDEFYLGRVAVGQTATAALAGKPVVLTVSRVLPQVTNGRFRVELSLGGAPAGPMRRGQTLDLRMTFGAPTQALVLPAGPWLDASGGAFVFVLDGSGRRATRRPVTVGRRNPEQVEITAGLRPGERVLVSSYAGFDKFQRLILK